MESGTPHTIGSVILTEERRLPDNLIELRRVPDHVARYYDQYYHPYRDPPHGFNSVKHRHGAGYCEADWADTPRYVMLGDHMTAPSYHVGGSRDYGEQRPGQRSIRNIKRLKPVDYDLAIAARAAAAKSTFLEFVQVSIAHNKVTCSK